MRKDKSNLLMHLLDDIHVHYVAKTMWTPEHYNVIAEHVNP